MLEEKRPVASIILDLAILLIAAIAGGLAVKRFGYPVALGELVVGILIGPFALGLVGSSELISVFAELGAIILLLYIGLEADPAKLKENLVPSLLAGVFGAIVPLVLGYYGAQLLGLSNGEALFIGAVLMATSLGITARAMADLGKLQSREGATIVGAGAVDDVVAIILLVFVLDLLAGRLQLESLGLTVMKALAFWLAVLVIGMKVLSKTIDRARISIESLTLMVIALAFIGAYSSAQIGLSTIIGAFAIGLSLTGRRMEEVREKASSLYLFFVPIFFVSVGMLVDVSLFSEVLIPGLFITALAILGKLIGCGGAALATGFSPRSASWIGLGMTPRGEIGLIIASIGLASGLIGQQAYSLAVMAVALTTLIALPLLKLYRLP